MGSSEQGTVPRASAKSCDLQRPLSARLIQMIPRLVKRSAKLNRHPVPPSALKFCVVTATRDAEAELPRLIRSLEAQTDPDFLWLVADGASTDSTLSLLAAAQPGLNLELSSQQDFGIYDALNRVLQHQSCDYYLVVGADDELHPDAVKNYKIACAASGADLVTARVKVGDKICKPRGPALEWLFALSAQASSHAVGLAIRHDLHKRYGWYSRELPIAADQFFLLSAIHAGAVVVRADFIAGQFARSGVSSIDRLGTQTEVFRVQVALGRNVLIQLLVLWMRVIITHLRKHSIGSR